MLHLLLATALATASIDAELKQIHDADQADRKIFEQPPSAWTPDATKGLIARDAARRARVHALLAQGKPATAEGWFDAALVYQHGDTPADYLLAHQLASVAAFDGHKAARWLAAASLDRYLNKIGQPQVFGTQYHRVEQQPFTQEPFDRSLPPSIREAFNVPTLAEAEARLKKLNEEKP